MKGEGKLGKIESQKSSILLAGGQALQKLLRNWMRELNSSRSKHGSNHFTPTGIHDPIVDGDNVAVGIYIPGITRALHDIVIRPVEAQSLAIPMHADAYGTSPREYNLNHPKGSPEALFMPKGKDYLAKNDHGSLVVMYLLRKSVNQKQDPTLLPTSEEINKTVMDAIHGAVEAVLSR